MVSQIISFKCLLKNRTGQVISSTFNREVLTAIQSDEPTMLLGLARGLQNLKKGDKRSIELRAEDAYGLYDPQKIILFPRKKLPKNIRSGQSVSIVGKSGQERHYKVLEMYDDMAQLDGNHPLAGQDLIFEIEAIEAREATPKEIDASCNMVSAQVLH